MATKQQLAQQQAEHDAYMAEQLGEDVMATNYDAITIAQPTSTALIPAMPSQAVSPLHGVTIPGNLTFQQKLDLHRQISEKIDGEAENVDAYLNLTLYVSEVYQHDVVVNVNKRIAGSEPRYEDKVRTVLHVVGVSGKKLSVAKKLSFSGISVYRYFATRIIPVFGMIFEEPIPFIIRRLPSGAYAVSTPEE